MSIATVDRPAPRLNPPGRRPRHPWVQTSLDDLGRPLRDMTFVVVDLETTGGSPATHEITEIGAVKVRGGEILGEFQTLVRPRSPVPPFITVLTGITDAMVADAPRVEAALPSFLEWAEVSGRSVLVAHNAPFDLGFLKAAATRTGTPWPDPEHLDTAILARRIVGDEVRNCKLATLAAHFGASTDPCHRALSDARATVDVLHALLDRVGNQGVRTMEDLRTYSGRVSPEQRRKRHLAAGLPAAPGVYLFRDRQGRPLYVGKSKDVRGRVRQYFVASEPRRRMRDMVALAESVDVVPCAHDLEAQVRELRLIAEHKPRFNRRSRFPERAVWLTLTKEPFPRLSVVSRRPDVSAPTLGPFPSRSAAEAVVEAIHDAVPLRRCSTRLSARRRSPSCVLGQIGRCGAPCEGRESVESYARHAAAVAAAAAGDPGPLLAPLRDRIAHLSAEMRYEEAAATRDRAAALARAFVRTHQLRSLRAVPRLVGARPAGAGQWDLVVVHHGRLVSAGVLEPGAASAPVVAALEATAEHAPEVGDASTAAEAETLLRWLEQTGTRIVSVDGEWSSPLPGPAAVLDLLGETHAPTRRPWPA